MVIVSESPCPQTTQCKPCSSANISSSAAGPTGSTGMIGASLSSAALLESLRDACPTGDIGMNYSAVDDFLRSVSSSESSLAMRLLVIIDYDLTMSAATTSECHHLMGDSEALPVEFRDDMKTLYAAARDTTHPEHDTIFGSSEDPGRPHRFWMHFNHLAVKHGISSESIRRAVAEEKKANGTLLRPCVGEFLHLCEAAGVQVVILSAGLEQVITEAFAVDGVALPPSCHLLTNRFIFDDQGRCTAVEPTSPPASREGKLRLLASLDALAEKDLVLMIGDKPVDARVGNGLPPMRALKLDEHSSSSERSVRSSLSFGFFNTSVEPPPPADLEEWALAFHLLARSGNACTFAPLVTLLKALLSREVR
eukprot:TRINITY_DN105807_c0_g1_i1.p1 TRINITY_DN105807_c0_g1~~TRINITY_DN105807_c0_g1_i1.p1  ORF type:complete len:366 (-),score=37.95 TRINITY_DN105807_c0_g1_i1:156-1253(-)